MRVGIIAVQHESNTFADEATTIEQFRQDTLLCGKSIEAAFTSAHHELGGFFEGLANESIESVPVFAARATPGGTITRDAAQSLLDVMAHELQKAGELDGLLVAPHGAAVSELDADFDGLWLAWLREIVAPGTPIVCTLDLHANVSPRMINACDATIGYRTNPHLDQRARGVEAARLLARTLRGEVRPVQALCSPPVAINIERQFTAEPPMRELLALAERQRSLPGVLSNTVIAGFPYADVAEMGSSFIVVTDGDAMLARRCADELGARLVADREAFRGHLISIADALASAAETAQRVCLLDTGDNVGGGAPGDGTSLIHALRPIVERRCFAKVFDPESVSRAAAAGEGGACVLSIGGKSARSPFPPVEGACEVRRLCEGRWAETKTRHGGATGGDMGPCAVVQLRPGFDVLLTTHRTMPFSLAPLIACGVDPRSYDILIAKGVHAPVAAYGEVCDRFIRVNTPGVTDADMTRLPFQHRRRPLFPFESV